MLISVAIVVGFKNTVSSKVSGFSSELKIITFDNNQSLEEQPITIDDELMDKLTKTENIASANLSALKAGVIKTDEQIQGIILKGIDKKYNTNFLKDNLKQGIIPLFGSFNDSVLISQTLSNNLNLKLGDDLRVWFISGESGTTRGRKFIIAGIYETSLEEVDSHFVIGDLDQIRKLNNWNENQAGSIELFCVDKDKSEETQMDLYKAIPYNMQIVSSRQEYPQIYNWLDLLDTNVVVVIALMILVAGITMISTLFIIILERTSMIGLLKSLGFTNTMIRKVFLYKAANIIGKGMFWGNIAGLSFYFVQFYFRLVKLSGESYYVDYVPVELHLSDFFIINIASFIICILILIVPSHYISRISPSEALRYE